VRVPAFTKRAKRQLVTHAKFFYFDTGVFRAVRPAGPLDSPAQIDGPALETLVLQELRAVNDYDEHGFDIYFWRTKSGLEVDFVLYGDNGLIAIEVKRARRLDPPDLRALREFKHDYPPARCFVFYGGTTRQYFDEIVAIPLPEALRELDAIIGGRLAAKSD
jgi:predicted AAA+ superfamily ATPase